MKTNYFLGIDIGNTNIEIGLLPFEKDNYSIKNNVRFFSRQNVTTDEFAFFVLKFLEISKITVSQIKALIYSSVVPPYNKIIEEFCYKYLHTRLIKISSSINLGIKNCYKNPNEVGADRLVNAAYSYYLLKSNCIIVDIGTATTICAVTNQAEYLGGIIFPGIQTSLKSLITNASQLTDVRITKCDNILTDNTKQAIQSGIYFSNYYALKGMITKLSQEVGFAQYNVIGTGGYASIFEADEIFDIFEQKLTLKGLKTIVDLNYN